MSRVRIFRQNLFSLRRQRVEPAPHVRHPSSQPHPRIARHWDHAINPCTRPRTAQSAVGPSTRIRRPSDKVMSTRCAQTPAPYDCDASVFGRVASTNDGSLTSMGKKVAAPSSSSFGTSPTCGANRGSFSHSDLEVVQERFRCAPRGSRSDRKDRGIGLDGRSTRARLPGRSTFGGLFPPGSLAFLGRSVRFRRC